MDKTLIKTYGYTLPWLSLTIKLVTKTCYEASAILGQKFKPVYYFSSGGLIALKLRYSIRS
jgi:hypothetical protein